MKTKPLAVAALVLIAVSVSAGVAAVSSELSCLSRIAYRGGGLAVVAQTVVVKVAKASARVLRCAQ